MQVPGIPTAPATVAAAEVPVQQMLSGTIHAQHVVGVGSPVDGNIDAFLVAPGEEAYEGEVLARVGGAGLESERATASAAVDRAQQDVSRVEAAVAAARLESSRADADAERARAQTDAAERIYSRQKLLNSEGATPRNAYLKAEREYESVKATSDAAAQVSRTAFDHMQGLLKELEAARKILADRTAELEAAGARAQAGEIAAPVDGIVVSRKGNIGEPAQPLGNDLFQIATDIYSLEVETTPPSELLAKIHPGQDVTVLVPDVPQAALPGTVREIRDGSMVVQFESPIPEVRPGMKADIRLKLE
jgi:multidrug resistance efflux pump